MDRWEKNLDKMDIIASNCVQLCFSTCGKSSSIQVQNFPPITIESCFTNPTLQDSQVKVGEIEQDNMTLQSMVPSVDLVEPLPWAFEDGISDLKSQKNVQLEISDLQDQTTSDRSDHPTKEIMTFHEAVAVLSIGSGVNNSTRQISSQELLVKNLESLSWQYLESFVFKSCEFTSIHTSS